MPPAADRPTSEATTSESKAFDLDAARANFPILSRRSYLNSCSLGALSTRSEAYLDEFQERWHDMGASAWYRHWLGRVEDLRGRVANFWGSTPEEVALMPSVSAALSVITQSVPAENRNRVICTELDFPTLAYQWAVKPEIELVVLKSPDGIRIDPEQFAAAVDERTLFLATSHVFFTTGYEQDIKKLADIARAAGAYSLIDGYQGAGQVPLTLSETGVDFYAGGPLKWLCGGPGLAYLYVRDELIQRLEPRITSWFATNRQFDFDLDGFEYRPDARRFEMGTPSLPTVHTALGGQELIDEVGIETIVARNRGLIDRLIGRATDAGLRLRLPEAEHRTAIVMVHHDDPPGAVRHLADHGVIVDHRPGFVRVSPHYYNTEEEVDRCVDVLAAFSA
ncbi:MAG: aminotransferase class V-fold PLP-dependent enzyme [Gemmatimonadetes bacterium]|nr:aminotransferase class V-fold PLP-dependent enzyme [Gemmatimonadota bacterium]